MRAPFAGRPPPGDEIPSMPRAGWFLSLCGKELMNKVISLIPV